MIKLLTRSESTTSQHGSVGKIQRFPGEKTITQRFPGEKTISIIAGKISGKIGRGITRRISGEIFVGIFENIPHKISGQNFLKFMLDECEMNFLNSCVLIFEFFSEACKILHHGFDHAIRIIIKEILETSLIKIYT